MSRFNYSEPLADEKPDPIRNPHYTSGDIIEGTTDEGEFVKGRITAIGETTYRIESSGRPYTIRMNQARYPAIEPLTESEVKGEESES